MKPLAVRTRPVEGLEHPLAYLPDHGGLAWVQGDAGLVGWGEAARIELGPGEDRFERARTAWDDLAAAATVDDGVGLRGTGLVAFGSFTFDARSPRSVLVVPEVVVGARGGSRWLTVIGPDEGPLPEPAPRPHPRAGEVAADRPRYAGSSVPDVQWLEVVAEAIERIRDGELDKVVLARDYAVWSKASFQTRVLARRLNVRFPDCWTFAVDGLVGATPELLVRRFGTEVESLALAGSARRGTDTAEDETIGARLLASEKDRWEHELAARTVAERLGPVCSTLTSTDPGLLRLDNVMHLATRFAGELVGPAPLSALELVGRLHPTAAVGGVPTAAAVELIRGLEGMDRGGYAGPVGWVDAAGDGEWGIALRCAELSGARARLFAGAGIVADSLPEDELEETRLKLRAMQSAFEA